MSARREELTRIAARLFAFYDWCAQAGIDELTTLATTIETWWPAIEAFIHTGITNAPSPIAALTLKFVPSAPAWKSGRPTTCPRKKSRRS